MRFILASSSPRRREIISRMLNDFDIIKPNIDETQHKDEAPLDYVRRLSQQKAQAIAEKIQEDAAILAADTVVILSADTIGIEETGEILGKPVDEDDARAILKRLRNRPHQVCTAFTIRRGRYQHTEVVCTTVHMRDYTDLEIDAYIATGDPFDKAGSYAIQHEAFHPVREIEGSYTNVVGLPEDEVRAELIRAGVRVTGLPFQVAFHEHQFLEFIACNTPFPPNLDPNIPMTFAICAVIQDDKYLLHYNPERKQWEHAGGGIEPNEHPDDTAVRELFEETGQTATNIRCHGVLKLYFTRDDRYEYAVLYSGELGEELAPFTPNNETSKLMLWDMNTAVDELLSQVSYGVLKYVL